MEKAEEDVEHNPISSVGYVAASRDNSKCILSSCFVFLPLDCLLLYLMLVIVVIIIIINMRGRTGKKSFWLNGTTMKWKASTETRRGPAVRNKALQTIEPTLSWVRGDTQTDNWG